MATYPLINGNRYDFSSIELFIAGQFQSRIVIGVKEISYSDTLEPGMVYGTHAQPIGRTRGQYKPEASMTMYRQEFDELVASLAGPLKIGFLESEFEILVMYSEGLSQPVRIDRILACRITKAEHNASGTDALEVKLTLSPMLIERDGRNPITKTLGGFA